MKTSELVKEVCNRTGYDKEVVNSVVYTLIAIIKDSLAAGLDVALRGFCVFTVVNLPTRSWYTPIGDRIITVRAKRYAKFRATPGLKNMLNK